MRTGMILAIAAVCFAASACTKKNSLYLEPGRPADAPQPAAHKPDSAPPAGVQKASDAAPATSQAGT